MQKIDKEMAPKLAAHQDAIHLNSALFARVEAIYNDRDKLNLDPESKWLLERYYKDFVRAGAKLSDADKKKLKAMNAELAELQTKFAAKCPEGKECVVDRGRQSRRSGRTFGQRYRGGGRLRPRRRRKKASLFSLCKIRPASPR